MAKINVTVKPAVNKGSESGIKAKKARHMGNLSIDDTQLPEIKSWEVGEQYDIIVRVRQTGIQEADKWQIDEYGYPKGTVIANFEILSARVEQDGDEDKEGKVTKKAKS